MMNLSSQNQRHMVQRAYTSFGNGSLPAYHPSNGKDFSGIPNKFDSVGMVVAGDTERRSAEVGPKDMTNLVDSGLDASDYTGLSNLAQRQLRTAALSVNGVTAANVGLPLGMFLLYAGLDFPFSRELRDVVKRIIDKPERVARAVSLGTGTLLIASSMQA